MIEGADDIYSRNLRGLLVNFLSAVKPERAGAGNSQILQDAQGNKDDVSKDLENAKSKEEKIVIISVVTILSIIAALVYNYKEAPAQVQAPELGQEVAPYVIRLSPEKEYELRSSGVLVDGQEGGEFVRLPAKNSER